METEKREAYVDKKLPGIVANAAVLILNVFAILMIVGLFLHQGTTGSV